MAYHRINTQRFLYSGDFHRKVVAGSTDARSARTMLAYSTVAAYWRALRICVLADAARSAAKSFVPHVAWHTGAGVKLGAVDKA